MSRSLIELFSDHPDSVLMQALNGIRRDGDLDRARAAVGQGANVDAVLFSDGTTLLMSACACGYTYQVKALCELGADVELRRLDGANALWCASVLHSQHQDAIKILISHGASSDRCGPDGADALEHLIQARGQGRADPFDSLSERISILEAAKIQSQTKHGRAIKKSHRV